jgi:hypothetical protein
MDRPGMRNEGERINDFAPWLDAIAEDPQHNCTIFDAEHPEADSQHPWPLPTLIRRPDRAIIMLCQ